MKINKWPTIKFWNSRSSSFSDNFWCGPDLSFGGCLMSLVRVSMRERLSLPPRSKTSSCWRPGRCWAKKMKSLRLDSQNMQCNDRANGCGCFCQLNLTRFCVSVTSVTSLHKAVWQTKLLYILDIMLNRESWTLAQGFLHPIGEW